jgi:hypothetical protein
LGRRFQSSSGRAERRSRHACGRRRAAATLDGFLIKWRNPPPGAEGFTVKIGLMDKSAAPGYALVKPGSAVAPPVEWFSTHLKQNSNGFYAEMRRNVSAGDTIRFTR